MPFREWTPTGTTVYNPFYRGNPTEIADKAIAGQVWSEPHYREGTRRLLGMALKTLKGAGVWPPTMSQIARHMEPERLAALAAEVGGAIAEEVCEYVDGLSARARSDLSGGRDRLSVLIEGELGPRLDPTLAPLGAPQIRLEHVFGPRPEVVYFNLEADRYPAASQLLAAALITDLISPVAELQGEQARGLVVMDEFAALAAREVRRLLARSRSAGLSIALATQSLADLRGTDPEDTSDTFTEQVFTNVSYFVVHREADPDSAERLAGVAGTVPGWSFTQKVGGGLWQPREGTKTREREFLQQHGRYSDSKRRYEHLRTGRPRPPAPANPNGWRQRDRSPPLRQSLGFRGVDRTRRCLDPQHRGDKRQPDRHPEQHRNDAPAQQPPRRHHREGRNQQRDHRSLRQLPVRRVRQARAKRNAPVRMARQQEPKDGTALGCDPDGSQELRTGLGALPLA